MEQILLKNMTADGILVLSINRPEKRNAINFQLIHEFNDAVELAERDDSIKCLVIKGEGDRAFCSGGDLSEFHALHTEEAAYNMLSQMGDVLYKLATCSKPTIAYLNGHAVGGGCEIATACDIRIARNGVKLGFVQGNQAITTGWGAATLLMEKLPAAQALQLLYSAAVVKADQAKQWGFVTELVNSEEEFYTYLQQFANKQRDVLVAYKQILLRKWKMTNIKERMHEEIVVCSKLWEKDEHLRAVENFRNGRK